MTFGIRTANDGTYVAITSGTEDVARFSGRNGDNSGQLAGFRNILLNPRISAGINQRGVANWAAVAIGAYGYDRWKKVDANTITQIVEAGNYTPSAVHTLSGNATATQQVTSPASGHWTIPAISNLETDIQLEEGYIASKRERRPKGLEEFLCQRYCRQRKVVLFAGLVAPGYISQWITNDVPMRTDPTLLVIGTPIYASASAFTVDQSSKDGFRALATGAAGACQAEAIVREEAEL